MNEPYLQTSGVYKRYGRQVVLRDINMNVGVGESIALFGANGAGKSTLLRILATLARPSRGTVDAFGEDAWKHRESVRQRIGVVGHQPYVYPELTCAENLHFYARMFELDADKVVPVALDAVGLSNRRSSAASTLSRGLLQRLNLARAILHQPPVLILDEPDTGLDRAGRQVLSRIVADQIGRDGAVIFTTHSFEFGLEMATRAVSLQEGGVSLDRSAALLSTDELDRYVSTPVQRIAE
ncbi:ABC transporter ATP-binding protein [soil metagenome]